MSCLAILAQEAEREKFTVTVLGNSQCKHHRPSLPNKTYLVINAHTSVTTTNTHSPGNLHLSTVHTMIHNWHFVNFTKALSVWYTEMGIQNSDWSSRSQGFPDMLQLCLKQVLLGKHWPRFSSTFTQIYQRTRTLGSFVKELQIIFAPLVLTACNMALGAEHDTSGILNPLSCFNTVHWMTEAFVECFRGILLPPPQKACTCMHLEICSAESYPFIRFYLLNMSESLSTSIRRTCVWHCVTLHSCKLVQLSIYSVQWLTSDAGLILFYLWWEKLDSEKNGSV